MDMRVWGWRIIFPWILKFAGNTDNLLLLFEESACLRAYSLSLRNKIKLQNYTTFNAFMSCLIASIVACNFRNQILSQKPEILMRLLKIRNWSSEHDFFTWGQRHLNENKTLPIFSYPIKELLFWYSKLIFFFLPGNIHIH